MHSPAAELRELGFSPASEAIDLFRFDQLNYEANPKVHWKKIQTRTSLKGSTKNLNEEVDRLGRFPFPCGKSRMRLAGCILINIDVEWIRVDNGLVFGAIEQNPNVAWKSWRAADSGSFANIVEPELSRAAEYAMRVASVAAG